MRGRLLAVGKIPCLLIANLLGKICQMKLGEFFKMVELCRSGAQDRFHHTIFGLNGISLCSYKQRSCFQYFLPSRLNLVTVLRHTVQDLSEFWWVIEVGQRPARHWLLRGRPMRLSSTRLHGCIRTIFISICVVWCEDSQTQTKPVVYWPWRAWTTAACSRTGLAGVSMTGITFIKVRWSTIVFCIVSAFMYMNQLWKGADERNLIQSFWISC